MGMGMGRPLFLLACALTLLAGTTVAHAAVVEHTFRVGNMTVRKLCQERTIVAVNGQLPGPTINAREGDTVVVHVLNQSPYNLTIHWHGIFQLQTPWADGPAYVTQCPILPGRSYTYRFNIIGQDGTLWWHAHFSTLRATVYGALIIQPRAGSTAFPFRRPYQQVPIVLGEWWNANVVDVENEAIATGGAPNVSDAYTINGMTGDLYPCSRNDMYRLTVVPGRTYLLRIINAALNTPLFFKVAGHSFSVVAADARYTTPYRTDVVVVAPGQTVDALLVANARPGRYYMAASPYISVENVPFDGTTTTGILQYASSSSTLVPLMPTLPPFNDTPTAHRFFTDLTALLTPGKPTVPLAVDEKMFVTFGLGLIPCNRENGSTCAGPFGQQLAASMNNVSFELPTTRSMLEAQFFGLPGIYTRDFPDAPPVVFDYTSPSVTVDLGLLQTLRRTNVKTLRYNSTVEVVLQNTALLGVENHPMHLHGFDFFVLAQGFGNYDSVVAERSFNLVNPQVRNTIAVPVGGWAVIRFVANNPGIWLMHCHLDVHVPMGLSMAFEVQNGPTRSSSIPPPPRDLPRC